MIFNEDQKSLMASALRLAAERYREMAADMRTAGHPGLATIFVQQAEDSNEFATTIDESDTVEVR